MNHKEFINTFNFKIKRNIHLYNFFLICIKIFYINIIAKFYMLIVGYLILFYLRFRVQTQIRLKFKLI